MSKIHTTIHDNFIRSILSDKNVAIDYFQSSLPPFVSEKLDFSTLTQISDTYLSEQLRKTMSDIVYTCRKKDEGEIKVALLIEHKSFPDKYTPVQIGGYIFSGLQKQIDNKEKLSIIIPVLLYHGRGKWKYQALYDLFKNLESDWRQFIPNFDYIYNNLGEISDEKVETLNNKFLVASLLALKHSFQKDWLESNAYRILILTEEAPKNLQRSFAVYVFERSGLDENRIFEIVESLPTALKETVMSTADIFIEKGRKIGIEEGKTGVVKNLLINTDFTAEKISKLTEVSVDFVLRIQIEIEANEKSK